MPVSQHSDPQNAQGRSEIPDQLRALDQDMTDEQWNAISPAFFGKNHVGRGRPRETSFRSLLNGIFYRHAHNCSWREVPSRYGGFRTLNRCFNQWSQDGTLNRVAVRLRIAELRPQYEEYMRLIKYDAIQARRSA